MHGISHMACNALHVCTALQCAGGFFFGTVPDGKRVNLVMQTAGTFPRWAQWAKLAMTIAGRPDVHNDWLSTRSGAAAHFPQHVIDDDRPC